MTKDVQAELQRQGFEDSRIHIERMLNMRFEGTDTALMVLPTVKDGDGQEDYEAAFNRAYKSEFGFVLDTKSIIVDYVKVGDLVLPHNEGHCLLTFYARSAVLAKRLTRSGSLCTRRSRICRSVRSICRPKSTRGTVCTSTNLDA